MINLMTTYLILLITGRYIRYEYSRRIKSQSKIQLLSIFIFVSTLMIFIIKLYNCYIFKYRIIEGTFFSLTFLFTSINYKLIIITILTNYIKFVNRNNIARLILSTTKLVRDEDNDIIYIIFPNTKHTNQCIVSFDAFEDFMLLFQNYQEPTESIIKQFQIPKILINYFLSNKIIIIKDELVSFNNEYNCYDSFYKRYEYFVKLIDE